MDPLPDTPDFTAARGETVSWTFAPNGPLAAAGKFETRVAVVIGGSYDMRTVVIQQANGRLKRCKARASGLTRYDGPEPPWAAEARRMTSASTAGRKAKGKRAKMLDAAPQRREPPSEPDLSHLSEGRRRAAQFVDRLRYGYAEVGGEDEE